ncbi:MAG: decarboxylating NADP(+)-dependent phosphogluconate dehydrogenase [Parachlamydiales bacterium]|nr:decarboxylating NADP(+)-dependent phosphogluconate dehydrogenase [Parachlamydiales bacterium]
MRQADIGVIGLSVMGRNLARNIADKGYDVSVFNRTAEKTREFVDLQPDESIIPSYTIENFISSLKSPKKILLMVQAGKAVDEVISQLLPFLQKGDSIIDGGNAHYKDTTRRFHDLQEKGILFLGVGISGGEEGARRGPSIMAGGDKMAWDIVKEIFLAISAKFNGIPCAAYLGTEGAGHFVKMVHNGIEYADMQLIAESYDLMKRGLQLPNETIGEFFRQWNQRKNQSYLLEITAKILSVKEGNTSFVDNILDVAAHKGTGRWVVEEAIVENIPLFVLSHALFSRFLSLLKTERTQANKVLTGPLCLFSGDKQYFVDQMEKAIYAAKIIAYAEGFYLLQVLSNQKQWNIPLEQVALIWRAGCIIRSRFLEDIHHAFLKNPALHNLLFDDFFSQEFIPNQSALRLMIQQGISLGIPLPCLCSALSYFDGYRSGILPANLIQAQRDFFGAHTFERIDRPRGEFFHHSWEEKEQ